MEVGRENSPNSLQGSATTTLPDDRLLEHDSINDNELGKQVSESNTQEAKAEESSVVVPKLDDPNPFVTVVGETAVEEEVTALDGKSVSGGCLNSGAVESTSVFQDEKDDDEVATKDEIPTADVADGGECEEVVVVRDNSLNAAEENVRNNGEDTNANALSVIENDKDGGESEMETMRMEEDVEVLKDGGEMEVPSFPVAETVEREEVMTDVKSDDRVDTLKESNEIVEGDEAITEVQEGENTEVTVAYEEAAPSVEKAVHEEGKTADEGKPIGVAEIEEIEQMVADEDKPLGVAEINKEEQMVEDEEKALRVTEIDEEEQMVAAEEKHLDVKDTDEKEQMVAVEEKHLNVKETDEEEQMVADEEKPLGVAKINEEEPMVADEEKSLGTDLETDEEAAMADEEKIETDLQETPDKSCCPVGRKRKRGGKNSKATPKSTGGARKKIEEDVCFICYDGGDLVLCDKRDCPKAYHPSCVNRDEAFFQTKGRWNCGWHLCSICAKKAEYMCYTCTFSLCKSCIKTNVISCVREKEKKGFCEACMKTVMLIENNSQENQDNIDFDDKNSWEYLFKDYWIDMKAKLNLSLSDLVEAKNAWKGSEPAGKQEPPAGHSDGGSGSENIPENQESQTRKSRRRKSKKHNTRASAAIASKGTSVPENTEWASKELLEFVMHMGKDESYQSQFDVQALLLEYIKTNKLRDTRRKSQIICDARLQRLFGKPRVGHFEMLKLLESHFLIKEDDDNQGSVVNNEFIPVDDDEATETVTKKDRKRKIRKKGDREPQSNRDDYAAIDIHNINLIYVRRKLAEDLLDDRESFGSKIIGTFVRIRIPGANHKHDIYRLVQVTGTTKGEQYAVGKKMTDTMLEISNLNKTESISIDTISNQDFTEDECKRLRQSIKFGFIKAPTVGDILDKAIELQEARVNDWIETEVVRLSHLRDRASDLGRKKELRECVEKLQVLKTPEERTRRLQDIPVVHDDPSMDPVYKSDDDTDEDKKQDMYKSSVGSKFSKRPDYPLKESWRGIGTGASTSSHHGKNYEFTRNISSNSYSNKVEKDPTSPRINEKNREQGRDRNVQPPSILKKPSSGNETEKAVSSSKDVSETSPKVNETEKLWHYKDPTGKIQGPFSMAQLRKWNNNKFFPVDLKIWRKSEKEDDGILLTDALEGRFTPSVIIQKPSPDERHGFANLPSPTPNRSSGLVGPSLYHGSNDPLQSPTPNSSQLATSLVAGGNKERNAIVQSGPQMVQSLSGQSAYGWSGGLPQNPQPSPSNLAGQQQLAYNQWGVQNPGGNFVQPQPVNVSWPTVSPNPNSGMVGPTPVMNWGTGNVNPTWGLQSGPGWVPPQPVQGVTPNQGWVAGPGPGPGPGPTQGPTVSGNGNHNWVGPQVAPPNPVEVASPGNQGASWVGPGPGNSNLGWGSPRPRNRSRWDENEQQSYNRSGGFHGNRRHWDKQGSFNNRGRSDH